MGIDYGPAHQGLEWIYVGNNEVLAKLTLPASVSETKDQFILHPSLLDSALQAGIGLFQSPGIDTSPAASSRQPSASPFLPFALERLEIIGSCQESMWAWVRLVRHFDSDGSSETKVQKLDIDLCDEDGNICAKMQGFSSRVLKEEIAGKNEVVGMLMVKPVWKEKSVDSSLPSTDYPVHRVFLCGIRQRSKYLHDHASHISFMDLESDQRPLEHGFEMVSLQLFETIQKILLDKPLGPVLIQVLVPAHGPKYVFSALSGLIKTAHLENPKVLGQMIAVDEETSVADIIAILEENSQCPDDAEIRYQDGKRYVKSFQESNPKIDSITPPFNYSKIPSLHDSTTPLKHHGVYLITGGAGGLGLIFAKEIAEKVQGAILILIGRSKLGDAKKTALQDIESLGVTVEYRSVDVGNKEAVEVLIQEIQTNFGGLNGIIHGAGVIRDNFILKKVKTEFEEVLDPKVEGVINLDLATKALDLDFMVLFSSGAGVMGNVGQADYATANAFMDAFAKVRNSLVKTKERRGRTLSINWSLWREGGMVVDVATEKLMKEGFGLVAMKTSSGIEAFYEALASEASQVMVMAGLIKRLKQKLLIRPRRPSTAKTVPALAEATPSLDTGHLVDKIQQMVIQTVSSLLKVKEEDLDVDAELSEYGFDSITLTDFANRMNQFNQLELTPTVFFEYPTIGSFAKYLAEEHQEVFIEQFRVPTQGEGVVETEEVELSEDFVKPRHRTRFARTAMLPNSDPRRSDPIAVVGMSGRFPMAKDVNEFWQNLFGGKDCITEIPKDRWDWQAHFGDPKTEANKTNIKWGGFIEAIGEFDPLFSEFLPGRRSLWILNSVC